MVAEQGRAGVRCAKPARSGFSSEWRHIGVALNWAAGGLGGVLVHGGSSFVTSGQRRGRLILSPQDAREQGKIFPPSW
jgi:hypothetical protein